MSNIVGNRNGVALWNLMAASDDELEQDYFARLNAAASKFGTVWFNDIVTQRNTRNNQTVWQLTWHADKSHWEITKFHTPEGAQESTDRIDQFRFDTEEVIELGIDDIIAEE